MRILAAVLLFTCVFPCHADERSETALIAARRPHVIATEYRNDKLIRAMQNR
ncbi:MAG: hypothetical protein MPJ24_10610 [Pirellulaceae bacterium]|nr:hypothetical protein [Pirellulaceae bacterium]